MFKLKLLLAFLAGSSATADLCGATGERSSAIGNIFLGGIIDNTDDISIRTLDFLAEINCRLKAPVHIFVSSGKDELLEAYSAKIAACDSCADFFVEESVFDLDTVYPNRIDKLSYIRDEQRTQMKELHAIRDHESLQENDFVIVLDLDLQSVPVVQDVEAAMDYMAKTKGSSDALCANGISSAWMSPYDTYATILLPDTWLFPIKLRLDPRSYSGEDPEAITKFHDQVIKGSLKAESFAIDFTSSDDIIPVKSCFGGMALYRAKTWFTEECEYTRSEMGLDQIKYLASSTGRVCEHTLFHECLRQHSKHFTIAVHAGLVTKYHDSSSFLSLNGDLKTRDLSDPRKLSETSHMLRLPDESCRLADSQKCMDKYEKECKNDDYDDDDDDEGMDNKCQFNCRLECDKFTNGSPGKNGDNGDKGDSGAAGEDKANGKDEIWGFEDQGSKRR